jgi:predicted transcriptional regulator of viral defense system
LNMCARPDVSSHDSLFAIAEGQDGYFTASQANDAGFGRSGQSYHVKAGNWLRVAHGIYRLNHFPETDTCHLVPWWLWSRGRDGIPRGVYSHETALVLHELTDANPARLHMTVPPDFRRSAPIPGILRLHKAKLPSKEVVAGRGYSVTTALRAIRDCATSGTVQRGQLERALVEAQSKGLITRREIREARNASGDPDWLVSRIRKASP